MPVLRQDGGLWMMLNEKNEKKRRNSNSESAGYLNFFFRLP
jgi:hypothetical protein